MPPRGGCPSNFQDRIVNKVGKKHPVLKGGRKEKVMVGLWEAQRKATLGGEIQRASRRPVEAKVGDAGKASRSAIKRFS